MLRRSRGNRRRRDPRPVWAAAAALLEYPTPELVASLDDVEALVPGDEDAAQVLGHLRSGDLLALQQEYVETFDHSRKCALHLTYAAYGDTRRRGLALLSFKQAYREAGVVWDEDTGELPDHLCAVLQLGATVDADAARQLLEDNRVGLETLRLALTGWRNGDGSTGSPWVGAVRAVCATLPTLPGDDADVVRRLVENGPPAEDVGLQGYGTDPLIAPATIPVGAPTGAPR